MNQFLLIVVILVLCAGAYMRSQQPTEWNQFLETLKSPGAPGSPASPSTLASPGNSETPGDASPSTAIDHSKPVYINPAPGTPIHSSHIVDVAQPSQADHPSAKVFVPPNPLPAQSSWVWTTSDGRTYRNVIIQRVEADRVTIYHDQGSAVIDISSLSDSIKSQLNYDPELASQAGAARSAAAAAAPATP